MNTTIAPLMIDDFCRRMKVDAKTDISLALLIELLEKFAQEYHSRQCEEAGRELPDPIKVFPTDAENSGEEDNSEELNIVNGHRQDGAQHIHEKASALFASLQSQLDKAQKFKEYTHERLDKMNIPTHPEGEHSKAGCRVGDRFDIVESQLEAKDKEIEKQKDEVRLANVVSGSRFNEMNAMKGLIKGLDKELSSAKAEIERLKGENSSLSETEDNHP